MILKKGYFSDFEILEINQQVNREEYQQNPITRTEMLNNKRQELPNRIEMQNTHNQHTTPPTTPPKKKKLNTRRQNTCKVDKKIMTEKKTT